MILDNESINGALRFCLRKGVFSASNTNEWF
jgi:hypothetical protein